MRYFGLTPPFPARPGLLMPALLFFWLSLGYVSCGPSIHSFKVDAQTVTAADSIKVDWEVSGKPTLLIHEKGMGGGGSAGGPEKYLELTLVAQKNGKEARQFIQVIVLPPISVDTIFLTVKALHGDTLIAMGEKNVSRWGDHFQLGAVASASGRPMWVTHAGKMVLVNGSDSLSFRGVSNSGPWEFRSLLTDAEKREHPIAPTTLSLQTILLYNKQ
jgi:hypothetical protein